MTARNRFAHYDVNKTAMRIHYDLPKYDPADPEEGRVMYDASWPPLRVEYSLVERELSALRAVEHFEASKAVFHFWVELYGQAELAASLPSLDCDDQIEVLRREREEEHTDQGASTAGAGTDND